MNQLRPYANKLLVPLAKKCSWMSPNALTWLSLGFSILAGYAFYMSTPKMLIWAALFVFLNGFFDAFDGAVAKVKGVASKRGDFLDHTIDRYADISILLGITFSAYCATWIGVIALLGVFLTSYMGTQAHALTGKRNYGGVLGRASRMVLLVLAPLVQYALLYYAVSLPRFTLIEYVMLLFAVLGNFTAVQRGVAAWHVLKTN